MMENQAKLYPDQLLSTLCTMQGAAIVELMLPVWWHDAVWYGSQVASGHGWLDLESFSIS